MFLVSQIALRPNRLPRVQGKPRALLEDRMVPKILRYSICIGTHTDNYMHPVLKDFLDTDCILLCFVSVNQQIIFFISLFFVCVMVPGGICFTVHLELCLCSLNKAAGSKGSTGRRRKTYPSLRELLSILEAEELGDSGLWLRQSVTVTSKSLKLMKGHYTTTVESR